MNKNMVRCPECGKWYFRQDKLSNHLIGEHDYIIELIEEAQDREEVT